MNELLCRICGGTENLRHISVGAKDLIHKLYTCANILIKEDDELPKYICLSCEEGLEFSYNLRKRGEETEKKLRQRLAANIQDQRDLDDSSHLNEIEESEAKPFAHFQNGLSDDADASEENDLLNIKHRAKRKSSCDTNDEPDCEIPSAEISFETKYSQLVEYEQRTINIPQAFTEQELSNPSIPDVKFDNLADLQDEIKTNIKFENETQKSSCDGKKSNDAIKYNVLAEVVISDDEDEYDDDQDCDAPQDPALIEDDTAHTLIKNEELVDYGDEDSVDYYFLDDSDCNEEQQSDVPIKSDINEYQHGEESFDRDSEADYCSDNIDYLINEDTVESSRCSIERVTEPDIQQIDSRSNDCSDVTNKTVFCYKCETCHEEFNTQATYREHIKQHGEKRFQCIQCSRWFPTRYRLESHERYHSDQSEMMECQHCHRNYRSRSNLMRHLRTVHSIEPNYTCEFCGMNFNRIDVLKHHKLRHVEAHIFECIICTATFKCKRYLTSHLKRHVRNTAEVNAKSTKTASSKAVTLKKIAQRTYICLNCGKESNNLQVHKNHLRIHSQELPFTCEICKKGFRTMAAVITHERMHTDNRPYQCEYCLQSFRQSSHLKEHKLLHTGEMPHICEVCGQAFRKKGNLISHMRKHTNERPYKCSTCNEAFARLQLLKTHAKNVHGKIYVWDRRDGLHEATKINVVYADQHHDVDKNAPTNAAPEMFRDFKNNMENNDTNNKHTLAAYLTTEFKNSATMTVIPCDADNDDNADDNTNNFDNFYTLDESL